MNRLDHFNATYPSFNSTVPPQQAGTGAAFIRPASPVRFGCRVFAYLSSAPYAGQDEFIRQCLLTGGNSIKRQNQLQMGEAGDTGKTAEEAFGGIEEATVHKAGWGIVYAADAPPAAQIKENTQGQAAPPPLVIEKSPFAVWHAQDRNHFARAAEKAAASKPKVVLAHLREAYRIPKQVKTPENAHPFQLGDWALMQHGNFPTALKEQLESRLRQWHAQDARSPLPQGEVDSERIACFVAARLQQKNGTANIAQLPTKQVREDFRQIAGEIIRQAKFLAPPEQVGTYNLVMSEGNRIFATHYSLTPRNMFVGQHRNAKGGPETLLATDPIQPLPTAGQRAIHWQAVEENSVISMQRARDGSEIKYECQRLLPEEPPSASPAKTSPARISAPARLWGKIISIYQAILKGVRQLIDRIRMFFNQPVRKDSTSE